jgi:hypothetical protein
MSRIAKKTTPRSRTGENVVRSARPVKARPRQQAARAINGIPLKRKIGWVYDTDSPEFKVAHRRDRKAIKSKDWDRDGMQWVEAVMNDPDWQKWWR